MAIKGWYAEGLPNVTAPTPLCFHINHFFPLLNTPKHLTPALFFSPFPCFQIWYKKRFLFFLFLLLLPSGGGEMDVNGGSGRRRVGIEGSPERGRGLQVGSSSSRVMRAPPPLSFRKVQVVYYLSRNGQLEHPHFMEISYLPSHQLRLKDVMDRLTALRGRGMPSLYSWSCKRCYKNGYVWNDLSANDLIYPADGAEYVLKGSEIIHGSSERFQQLQLSHRISKPTKHQLGVEDYEYMEEEEEEIEEEDGRNLTAGNRTAGNGGNRYRAPFSRCSRGVSTEELVEPANGGGNRTAKHHIELPLDDASPPSSSSSDKAAPSGSTLPAEDGSDSPGSTRNSVLLQLISCGGAPAVKAGGGGRVRGVHGRCAAVGGAAGGGGGGRRSGGLHRGVLSRLATRAGEVEGELEEGEMRCLSENPRFGNPQAEEKEYFSGSIVESMAAESGRVAADPTLKKSSSYNEERSSKAGIGEGRLEPEEEERGGGGGGVKGKCIPGSWKRSSSKQQQQEEVRK